MAKPKYRWDVVRFTEVHLNEQGGLEWKELVVATGFTDIDEADRLAVQMFKDTHEVHSIRKRPALSLVQEALRILRLRRGVQIYNNNTPETERKVA